MQSEQLMTFRRKSSSSRGGSKPADTAMFGPLDERRLFPPRTSVSQTSGRHSRPPKLSLNHSDSSNRPGMSPHRGGNYSRSFEDGSWTNFSSDSLDESSPQVAEGFHYPPRRTGRTNKYDAPVL